MWGPQRQIPRRIRADWLKPDRAVGYNANFNFMPFEPLFGLHHEGIARCVLRQLVMTVLGARNTSYMSSTVTTWPGHDFNGEFIVTRCISESSLALARRIWSLEAYIVPETKFSVVLNA